MMEEMNDARTGVSRRRLLALASGVAFTGMAGCGGDGGDTPTAEPTTTEATGTATPTDPTTPTSTETPTGTATPADTGDEDLGDSPADLFTLSGSSATSPDSTLTVEGTLSNPHLFDLQAIEMSVTVPEGWSVSPSDPHTFDTVDSLGSQDVSWEVTVPPEAEGAHTLTVEVHFESATDSADVTIERAITVLTGDVPIDGLLAHYPLDGDAPTDAVGDNDASINGDPITDAAGQVGGTYDFDGEDDFLTYPALDVAYDGSADWTTSLWINADTLPSDDHYFIWHPRAQKDIFILVYGDTDEIRFSSWDGGDDFLESGVTLTTDEWIHLCVVSDTSASDQYKMYVDGTLEGESDLQEPGEVSDSNLIGGQNAPDLDMRYFDGRIDEVRLYDRALSEEEVATLAAEE